MAKKKLKMTDTKVRVVVIGAILLAFIFAMYLIFKKPKVCPAGQILGSSGKCVADPSYCKDEVGKSWYCMSDKCSLQQNGVCRDCPQKDWVKALSNSATIDMLKEKNPRDFGAENPLLGTEQKICQPTCKDGGCNDDPDVPGECVFADFGSGSKKPGGKGPKVCQFEPIWYGVPTTNNGSYRCKQFSPQTTPETAYNFPSAGGHYKSLKECATDTWASTDTIPEGFAVDDFKNNNCKKIGTCSDPTKKTESDCTKDNKTWTNGKCSDSKQKTEGLCLFYNNVWTTQAKGDVKFNADNTDCNTYPCTDLALGGWGSSNAKPASTSYVYQRPQRSVTGFPQSSIEADESLVGTCFKTYQTNDKGVEEPTAPQKPDDNDTECNTQKNERDCRSAAYPEGSTHPHCKWYPAGSCQRYASFGKSNIYDTLKDTKDDKRQTFETGFLKSASGNFTTPTYPKILDYDASISNCRHKLIHQGASSDDAESLCGQLNEGDEFNPLEFRRCSGVVANQYGNPTFHTSMYPFYDDKNTKMTVTLGSIDGDLGTSLTNQYCARGASCLGRDQVGFNTGLAKVLNGQSSATTMFPVADQYCNQSCDVWRTSMCDDETCWCKPMPEDNSRWSTSKGLKKVIYTQVQKGSGKTADQCLDNWYKNEYCSN